MFEAIVAGEVVGLVAEVFGLECWGEGAVGDGEGFEAVGGCGFLGWGEEEVAVGLDEVGEGDGDALAGGSDEDGFGAVFLQGVEGSAKGAAVDAGPEAFFGGGGRGV